jgi:glyoxylase-like metal-dependent hydrolase (beta-lactamase superfamily II)
MSKLRGLQYDVFVSNMAPVAGKPLPDGSPAQWSPLAHTLIYGSDQALLIDPPITREQADAVAAWVSEHNVALRYIYLTHAHADHWLTTNYLLDQFPEAAVLSSASTLSRIAADTTAGGIPALWTTLFGDALPPAPVGVTGSRFPGDGIRLDGHQVFAHEVGHTDTDDTSILHVPALDLVVAGDVVYNNVHQYVAEGGGGGIESWQRALDTVAGLKPQAVVAGHKDPTRPNSPSDIDQTRRYLDETAAILDKTTDRAAFYHAMRERFPERVNPYTIWLSGLRLFPN